MMDADVREPLDARDGFSVRPRKHGRAAVAAASVESSTLERRLMPDGVEIENFSDYEALGDLGVSRTERRRPEDQSWFNTQKSFNQLSLSRKPPGEPPTLAPQAGQKRGVKAVLSEESPHNHRKGKSAGEDFDPDFKDALHSPNAGARSKKGLRYAPSNPVASQPHAAHIPIGSSSAVIKARRQSKTSKAAAHPGPRNLQPQPSNAVQDSSPSPRGRPPQRPRTLRASEPLGPQQLLLQPDSRPISEEQLASEVKSIYAGLAMVETKCMHVDKAQALAIKQASSGASRVLDDHWQALIALHRTLLHEHHDFFLASQHPAASLALQRLAAKYAMPARMWKHGIHSFLELLRQRLPESKEYMLAFNYLAYQMMALLYETVPSFLDTWIECLGDLARYRMAIEDEDMDDREHWAGVARTWYNKAASRNPTVGRLYHHRAILARPNIVHQLSLYYRALTVVQPFASARESVETFFDPIFRRSAAYSGCEVDFVRANGTIYRRGSELEFRASFRSFLNGLDDLITRQGVKFKDTGTFMAITLLAGLFEYGSETSELGRIFHTHYKMIIKSRQLKTQQQFLFNHPMVSSKTPTDPATTVELSVSFLQAHDLAFSTFRKVLRYGDNPHVLAFVHIILAFLSSLYSLDKEPPHLYVETVLNGAPWKEIATFLNTIASSDDIEVGIDNGFQVYKGEDTEPLPEDHHMNGQAWTVCYFPEDWFPEDASDDEDPPHEPPSVTRARLRRVLCLGTSLASNERCGLQYNPTEKVWSGTTPIIINTEIEITPENVQTGQDIRVDTVQGLRPASVSVDIEMTDCNRTPNGDTDSPQASEEKDSPEMEMIKERKSHAGQQHSSTTRDGNCQRDPRSNRTMGLLGAEILQKYKTVICDANLFLYQLDVFKVLVEQGDWDVVVPNSVIIELKMLSQKKNPAAAHAREALGSIKIAITDGKRVRIIDPSNMDVTKQKLLQEPGVYGEQIIDEEGIEDDESRDIRDPEDILIGVARYQSDLSLGSDPDLGLGKAAVLLTEDRAIRLKAAAKGVAAIAASVVKRARRESKSSQGISS